jgi:hypothetical protein
MPKLSNQAMLTAVSPTGQPLRARRMTDRSRISAPSHIAHASAIRNQVTIPVSQNNVWIMDTSMMRNATPVTAFCESLIDDLAASQWSPVRFAPGGSGWGWDQGWNQGWGWGGPGASYAAWNGGCTQWRRAWTSQGWRTVPVNVCW